MGYDAGLDIGSVSIHCIVIDETRQIVYEHPATRHFGQVLPAIYSLLKHLTSILPSSHIRSLTFTGLHGRMLSESLDAHYEVETVTQILGTVHIVPDVRSIICIGGQTSMLIQLVHSNGTWQIENYSCNSPCASGTGSFIDQQAERLCGESMETTAEFSQQRIDTALEKCIRLGCSHTRQAPVASRCTVFTKSDMIHLQNKGESSANIIAGFHYSNATNFFSTLSNNKTLASPAVFTGGVAGNALQLKALRQYCPFLTVPDHHASLGALGAALQAQKMGWQTDFLHALSGSVHTASAAVPRAEPLRLLHSSIVPNSAAEFPACTESEVHDVFLGIDIGSTTTKYVLLDNSNTVIAKKYTQTGGKPLEVTRRLLHDLSRQMNGNLRINGIATTGSGRHVVGAFCKANLVIDEITAHARAATEIDPAVDTIFEIGGQDSKYINIANGNSYDFAMNKVCAAGTGSFLHELAQKLNVNIIDEFQKIALAAKQPVALNDRCTVFMESELLSYLQQGVSRGDLVAGLCYAVAHNYLNRVVGTRPIGDRILYLGGTALNRGIIAAFEQILSRPLIVPAHCEVMGAYGAALSLKDAMRKQSVSSHERDLARIAKTSITLHEMACRSSNQCTNACSLKVYDFGKHRYTWGGECGKYEIMPDAQTTYPNFFRERQTLFREYLAKMACCPARDSITLRTNSRTTVGIPLALHGLEWGILWCGILSNLGYSVIISPKTDITMALNGVETLSAETCFPLKVFTGHIQYLLEHADFLFLPNLVDQPAVSPGERGVYCPLVTGSAFISKAALNIPDNRLISPMLFLNTSLEEQTAAFSAGLPSSKQHSRRQIAGSIEHGWHLHRAFKQELINRGQQFLKTIPENEQVWIITGRPYNLYDERCNLHAGALLHKLGVRALPFEYLDLSDEQLDDFPDMYWGMGSRILRAARRIARTPNFYGVHLSNFACGPDSFIEHFYRHILRDKSPLLLELDEHNAEGAILTRLEAYLNIVNS